MYCITDAQVEFILSDIRARGVELEDLQLNLLDHICCVIEQELEENGDFGLFYEAAIKRFYKHDLREIEEETQSLLANKNYYVMKKIMIYSGVFSAAVLTAGILFKYMHSPGSGVMITSGIVASSLIFIPLLFALKVKEKQTPTDKMLVGLGTLSGIAISLGILFKIQHWPGANMLCVSSLGVMMLFFLPVYFFGGIRNPQTKVNTIVTSILIIVGCGLFFSMTMTPQSSRMVAVRSTADYLRNEQILLNEQRLLDKYRQQDSTHAEAIDQSRKVYAICEELTNNMLSAMMNRTVKTGDISSYTGPDEATEQSFIIPDYPAYDLISQHALASKLDDLRKNVAVYNELARSAGKPLNTVPVRANIVDAQNIHTGYRVINALNDLCQIRMVVLQNQRELAML